MENCDICGKKFRLRFALREHVRKLHGNREYILEDHIRHYCEFCSYATFSERAFTAHSFLAHSEETSLTYKCRLCCLKFKNRIQAIRHRKSKAHKRKFKMKTEPCERIPCGFCEKSFDEIKDHEDHMWAMHQEQTSQCGLCGLRFAIPQELSAHARMNCLIEGKEMSQTFKLGRKIVGRIACDERSDEACRHTKEKICDFTCDTITMLYYHKMLKHLDSTKDVSLDVYSSEKYSKFTRMDREPSKLNQRLSCIVCRKDVAKEKLWQHLSTHGDTTDTKNRKCDLCFKIFPTILHLKSHRSRDNNCTSRRKRESKQTKEAISNTTKVAKMFGCSFSGCNYSTLKSSHLKAHELVHDQNAGNRIVCRICRVFSCKRKSELNRHMRSHHPLESNTVNTNSFATKRNSSSKFNCKDCKYSSFSKQHYSRHLLIHSSSNKCIYKCKFCNFTCATVENLRKHILKTNCHPGSSIYTCTQLNCSFSSNEANQYKNHLISEHRSRYKSLQAIRTYIKEYFLIKGMNLEG